MKRCEIKRSFSYLFGRPFKSFSSERKIDRSAGRVLMRRIKAFYCPAPAGAPQRCCIHLHRTARHVPSLPDTLYRSRKIWTICRRTFARQISAYPLPGINWLKRVLFVFGIRRGLLIMTMGINISPRMLPYRHGNPWLEARLKGRESAFSNVPSEMGHTPRLATRNRGIQLFTPCFRVAALT